jgi:cation-transporting ATPase 13A1
MSVICECKPRVGGLSHWYSFVKGSPEALGKLISKEDLPTWYFSKYESLARSGLRVLALAYRELQQDDFDDSNGARWWDLPRSVIEDGLKFCGFIAFQCKIRADSKIVIQSLLDSDHKVLFYSNLIN